MRTGEEEEAAEVVAVAEAGEKTEHSFLFENKPFTIY